MAQTIPQDILDALTDVDMPRLVAEPGIAASVMIQGHRVPIYACGTVIMGSGAAGLRAAVELKRRDNDVVVISQSAWGGTSACSGSDKQTLHTANTSDRGDNFMDMARAIRAGGAMDEDTAYVEAWGRFVRWRRYNTLACRCRRTILAERCAIRPTMTMWAAPRVAGRAPHV